MIKIYNDRGVERKHLSHLQHELSPWQTAFISAQDIIQSDWASNTSLLIIPGGRDIPYHQALKGKGNQRIRSYVENGGSFLGICAGAYYGCQFIEFDQGRELEVVGARELAFFPGIARGPAYGPGTFRYQSEAGARAAFISNTFTGEPLKSYHNGGCYFVDAMEHANVSIISKYLDIQDHPAAIIEVPVGKGKVILSGVHIETGSTLTPLLHMLNTYETQRKNLFHSLIKALILDTGGGSS